MANKLVNTEYLDSVSGGDTDVFREIVIMFKEQSIEIYNEMTSLYSERNYTSLGFLAHKAKSSVAIMGMNDLAVMLKIFELQAKGEKEPELYESYINRFKEETDAAVKELEDLVNLR